MTKTQDKRRRDCQWRSIDGDTADSEPLIAKCGADGENVNKTITS